MYTKKVRVSFLCVELHKIVCLILPLAEWLFCLCSAYCYVITVVVILPRNIFLLETATSRVCLYTFFASLLNFLTVVFLHTGLALLIIILIRNSLQMKFETVKTLKITFAISQELMAKD